MQAATGAIHIVLQALARHTAAMLYVKLVKLQFHVLQTAAQHARLIMSLYAAATAGHTATSARQRQQVFL
jgi:hypothetical protein